MTSLSQLKKWFQQHLPEIRKDYFHFLRFRSISCDPDYREEVLACSQWVRSYLAEKIGMKAECLETDVYPVVYAENLSAGEKAPTLLIYGHYDVQPVDPLELWKSDPFEAAERDGLVFARGAADDKGQIFFAMLAARAWKELGRELPINLKFCIEGEEEAQSLGLSKALPKLREKLRADYLLIPDFGALDKETPAITLGGRGLICAEVVLTGSNTDLHSGSHGGTAYNPNRAMAEVLAKLWDPNGRVQIQGFYDDVVELSEEEKKKIMFRYTKEEYREEFGIEALGGEKGRSMMEAAWLRPTVEINGLYGGYAGAGFKTVIPAQCVAKISCRLVPNQNPEKIAHHLTEFFQKNVAAGIKVKVHVISKDPAFRGDPNSQLAKAAKLAAEEAAGRKCETIFSGGSIPVISELVRETKAAPVGMGYGLPHDNIHAPNESFSMDRIEKGFLTVARTIELL